MISKITAKQLYAEMDKNVPGWRLAGYPSFDAAVMAAGSLAVDMCAVWRTGFERKTNSRMAAADARKATNERLAQEIREKEEEDDSPVFDRGCAGRRVSAERHDEAGREDLALSAGEWLPDEDGPQRRGAMIGFGEDNLLGSGVKAAAWSDEPLIWDPVAPRSYAGSPKCY